jgi:hypothetical protein
MPRQDLTVIVKPAATRADDIIGIRKVLRESRG